MDIGFRVDRHVEIDHMRDVVDVDASGSDVGCDEHHAASVLECLHRLGSLVLCLVRVDRFGSDRFLSEETDQAICTDSRLGEDQHSINRVLIQH